MTRRAPVVRGIVDDTAYGSLPTYTQKCELRNYSGVEIHVVDVFGNKNLVPDQWEGGEKRIVYKVHNPDIVKKYRPGISYGDYSTYTIKIDDLVDNRGILFLPDLNVVVCTTDMLNEVRHPLSRSEGEWYQTSFESSHYNEITLVDNHRKLPELWVNFLGTVRKIERVSCKFRRPGLYILVNNSVADSPHPLSYAAHIPENVILDHFFGDSNKSKFDGLRYFHLDKPSAQKAGDIKEVLDKEREMEMTILKQKLQNSTYELEDLRKRNEMESLARDTESKKVEHDLKLKSLETKDYYDTRSHVRKDVSDTWKHVPTFVAALGVLLTVFKP